MVHCCFCRGPDMGPDRVMIEWEGCSWNPIALLTAGWPYDTLGLPATEPDSAALLRRTLPAGEGESSMKGTVVLLFAVALLAACGGPPPANPARIAFVSNRDGNYDIYAINDDGSGLARLSDGLASEHHPACSPDGSRIAFESTRDGNVEIYLMNADGTGLARLTRDPAPDFEPTWSPDGSRIAYTSFRSGNGDLFGEIYLMNADGSGLTRLTDNPTTDAWPAWSPDGRRLAFVSDRDGELEVYVMNTDGSNLARLTNDPADNRSPAGSPAWSPDGRRIAFVSSRDGTGQIYVVNADGSAQTNLTNNPETSNCCPAWSPDGTRIAFLSRPYEYQPGGSSRGKSALHIMDPDGGDQTLITDHDVWERKLVWSPDSRRIAFESTRDGNLEIYVINADGSSLTRLTSNPADDGWPAGCGSGAPASP